MTDEDWDTGFARSIGMFLNGDAISEPDARGQRVTDDSFVIVCNAHDEPVTWVLDRRWGPAWETVIDTARPAGETVTFKAGDPFAVTGRSVAVLIRRPEGAERAPT